MNRRPDPRSSLDRFVAAAAQAGLRYTERGDHVQSECPTHSDQNPSLSVDYKPGAGQTVFKCQAGCDAEDVRSALELTWPMLYDNYEEPDVFAERRAHERQHEANQAPRPRRPRQQATKPQPEPARPKGGLPRKLTNRTTPEDDWALTRAYDYVDAEGEVIQQEVRYERQVRIGPKGEGGRTATEKRITQRYPDGHGRWLTSAPRGFVPVLYGLPDVAAWIAEGRRIWLCEGVKDVERFLEIGEAATTNPSGASNFKACHGDSLAGAHVVMVLDHDVAGYKRARQVTGMLTHAESISYVLPRVPGKGSDGFDHFEAGYGVDDFIEVSLAHVHALEHVAEAEKQADLAREAVAEAEARFDRVTKAGSDKDLAAKHHEAASRWVAETGITLVRATRAMDRAAEHPIEPELIERLLAAITSCQESVRSAHETAQATIPEDLGPFLAEVEFPDNTGDDDTPPETGAGDNVVDLPTAARLPDPSDQIPMSRGVWAYELGGDGRRTRGVYQLVDSRWVWVAPLPHLHRRITSRDGYGKPTGTYYLISATPDGDKVIIGQDELTKNTWPNLLGLPVSHDDKILKAATTALIFAADVETELVEATPRVTDEGAISLPVPETLPHGYLASSPVTRDEGMTTWSDLVHLAAQSPRMAMVLGASAFGPFVAALDRQPHIVSMHGEMAQGKSVTMRAAAAVWGHPGSKSEQGVCETWNQSKLAPSAFLGELGVLPAFFDEIGMAGNLNAADWGKRIFDICEGASRGRPAANGRPGFVRGRSWYGILMSAGNSRLMDGIGAGGMSGTQRRVVELATPFTTSRAHSDAIEALVPAAYGHLGNAILEQHSTATVTPYLVRATELLGSIQTDSPVAHEIIKHLHSHIAGAAIIDDLCGTDGMLTAAAVEGAYEYLAEWEEPLHDADRLLDAIHDSLFQEPACWPTKTQYVENGQPFAPGSGGDLPRHGVALKTKGVCADDQSWLGVIPSVWTELCEELGVDSDVACRELIKRGVLFQQSSSKGVGRRHNTTVVKIAGKTQRFYKLAYPDLDEPSADTPQPPLGSDEPDPSSGPNGHRDDGLPLGPVTGGVTDPDTSVTASVTAADESLTCGVTAVTAVTAPSSHVGACGRDSTKPDQAGVPEMKPAPRSEVVFLEDDQERPMCLVCGRPVGVLITGRPLHRGPCEAAYDPTQHGQGPTPAPDQPPADDQDESETEVVAQPPSKPARFHAPVAVLAEEQIHLPRGEVAAWPETLTDLSDLAMLAGRDHLRLGHGGGETLPEPGVMVLTSQAVLDRIGIPEVELSAELQDMEAKTARQEKLKLLEPIAELPVVADAEAKGWVVGTVDAWMRVSHPDLLPGGVTFVVVPWINDTLRDIPLLTSATTPGELVDNLADFAHVTGVQFFLHAAVTAHRLINHTRPLRRDEHDLSGKNASRVAAVAKTRSELPPFYRDQRDRRFSGAADASDLFVRSVESDYSWWRSWHTLLAHESECLYVHSYDRKASYLEEWRNLDLGVDGLIHRVGDAAAWDGRERPGLHLVVRDWGDWPEPMLPEPRWNGVVSLEAHDRDDVDGVWVTTPTLKALSKVGIRPVVVESWTWDTTTRYLEPAARRLIDARQHSNPAVAATAKQVYARGSGRFGRTEGMYAYDPLWRPDWYDHIRASARLKILITLQGIHKRSDVLPLAVGRDSILFASNEKDPVQAWPGDPKRLGNTPGLWAPEASGMLQEWGPLHLPERKPGQVGGWASVRAMDALVNHKKGDGDW